MKPGNMTRFSNFLPVRNRSGIVTVQRNTRNRMIGGRSSYQVSPLISQGHKNGQPDSVSESPRQCVKHPTATATPSHQGAGPTGCPPLAPTAASVPSPGTAGTDIHPPRAATARSVPSPSTVTDPHSGDNHVPSATSRPRDTANANV